MFRRPQFFKTLLSKAILNPKLNGNSSTKLLPFSLSNNTKSPFKYPIFFFSSSSQQNPLQNEFLEDLKVLDPNQYSQEQKNYMAFVLQKYARFKDDLSNFTQEELLWVSDALFFLSLVYNNAANDEKAYKYLKLENELYQRLGVKDTKEVAQNHFGCAIILKKSDPIKAEHHYKETIRICDLLGIQKSTSDIHFNSFSDLATINMEKDPEKALEYYQLALAMEKEALEMGLQKRLMRIYEEMRYIYIAKNDLSKAVDITKRGLDFLLKYFGDQDYSIFCFSSDLASLYAKQGQYARAEQYAEEALTRAAKAHQKDSIDVAATHALLGSIHNDNEDFVAALESYGKAEKIYEKLKSDDLKTIHFQLAMIYYSLGSYGEGWKYLSKASSAYLNDQAEPSVELGVIHWKMGKKFKENKRDSESFIHFEKALEVFRALEPLQTAIVSDIYGSMASMAYNQQDWSRALEFFKEAERYLDKEDSFTRRALNTYLGSIHRKLKNYDESFTCLQEAIKSAQETGEISFVVSAFCELGEYYKELERWDEALEAYMNAKQYDEQDPLHTQTIQMRIAEVQEKIKEIN